ncbi:hypothetical protein [Savagea faecisuis]|uniref:Uncharacterized protein n=1 Tax=Savagea faecisuis TaxID=1274803 RepID=A0ABW3GZL7_9BACL
MSHEKENVNLLSKQQANIQSDHLLREKAQSRLVEALHLLPVQNMSKKDLEDWLQEEDY